jgi:hypothetical protein
MMNGEPERQTDGKNFKNHVDQSSAITFVTAIPYNQDGNNVDDADHR